MRWGGVGVSSRWCFLADGTRGVEGGIRDESQESRCEQGTPVIGGRGGHRRRQEAVGRTPPRATGSPGEYSNSLGLKEIANEKSGTFRVAWKRAREGFSGRGLATFCRVQRRAQTPPSLEGLIRLAANCPVTFWPEEIRWT